MFDKYGITFVRHTTELFKHMINNVNLIFMSVQLSLIISNHFINLFEEINLM